MTRYFLTVLSGTKEQHIEPNICQQERTLGESTSCCVNPAVCLISWQKAWCVEGRREGGEGERGRGGEGREKRKGGGREEYERGCVSGVGKVTSDWRSTIS